MNKTILFITSITICSFSYGQKKNVDSLRNSRWNSSSNLVAKTSFANFSILDTIVNNYTLFFTGENHLHRAENSNIALNFQKYLSEKAGVNNLLVEFGFARGFMIDAYINGDTAYLDMLENTSFKGYIEYYKKLKTFNDSLPDGKKIHVHGVDVERFYADAFNLMDYMLPKEEKAPEDLEFDLEVIKSYASYNNARSNRSRGVRKQYDDDIDYSYNSFNKYFYSNRTVDSILASYFAKKASYQNYIPAASFTVFDRTMESLKEYRIWQNYSSMPHKNIYREREIYKNITQLLTDNPSEKYFGQFGRCHTSKNEPGFTCNWHKVNPTVKRLNEGSAKDKVLNLAIIYRSQNRSSYYNDNYSYKEVTMPFSDSACNNQNIIIPTKDKDSLVNTNFPYVVYNNSCTDNNVSYSSNDKVEDYHEWAISWDIGAGQSTFDLSNLNNSIGMGTNVFNNKISQIELGYSYSDFAFYHTLHYYHSINQNDSLNNNKYRLGFGGGYAGFGVIPHISNKFAFAVFGAVGFDRMSLTIESDSFGFVPANGFDGVNSVKFFNPAMTVGGGLDLKYAFSPNFGIFARGIYLHDISNTQWRYAKDYSGKLIQGSPKTNLSRYSITAGISLMIQY